MNELRLGHRVRCRDYENEQWKYGYFVLKKSLSMYLVVEDVNELIDYFRICELDPDATEFLPGDEVINPDTDYRGIYVGLKHPVKGCHMVYINDNIVAWPICQYPREAEEPDEDRISRIERRIEALERNNITVGPGSMAYIRTD